MYSSLPKLANFSPLDDINVHYNNIIIIIIEIVYYYFISIDNSRSNWLVMS